MPGIIGKTSDWALPGAVRALQDRVPPADSRTTSSAVQTAMSDHEPAPTPTTSYASQYLAYLHNTQSNQLLPTPAES